VVVITTANAIIGSSVLKHFIGILLGLTFPGSPTVAWEAVVIISVLSWPVRGKMIALANHRWDDSLHPPLPRVLMEFSRTLKKAK
jgi:hypothetical protein